jgi:UbiD family decarboxylase
MSLGIDLRSWLSAAESFGELRHVRGAHWDTELGAIAELSYRTAAPRALLFEGIEGYATGRVLTGSTGSARRLGHTLNLGDDLDDAALLAALRGKPSLWAATAREYPTETVKESPLLSNLVDGADVDLLSLPVPRWHAHDGGRYLGTGCLVITCDPETRVINGGCYRMQVVDGGRTATVHSVPGKHGAQHVRSWFDRGEKAPVVVSFGHHPALLVTGGTEVPFGISELEYTGAIFGQRLPVLIGAHTGLPIPAGSEVAVEGWLRADHVRDEGPFGEWTGYYSSSGRPTPALEIARLYFRDDPILLGAPPGKPPHDYSYMRTVMKSAMIEDALTGAGVPGIRGAWAHEAGGGRLFVAVSVQTRYAGHSKQVGHLTAQLPAAAYMNRFVIVVDDDIDVSNLDEVVWAMCTRCDPVRDIDVIAGTWGSRLDPLLEDGLPPYNSRAVIDATRPYERRTTFPRVSTGDPAYLESVRTKWAEVLT